MGAYEAERTTNDRATAPESGGIAEGGWESHLRLGQDVRFVLVAVGGGGIRIGREIARRHLRHLETVAINCDPKVQGFDDFDRRVYLGPDTGAETDTGGSPFVGGLLARAAEPALRRIFEGATFVILVGSLGGGAGSGAFPYILEVACRNSEVVSAFVVKPFRCEGERRALADRAIGRLAFVEAFNDKRERGLATLQTLDNESLVAVQGRLAFNHVAQHWASLIEDHIEKSFLAPVEALLETAELGRIAQEIPLDRPSEAEVPEVEAEAEGPVRVPAPPELPAPFPSPLPAAGLPGAEVELTFEVEDEARPPNAN